MESEFTLLGGILRFESLVEEIRRHLEGQVNVPPGDTVQFAGALGAAFLGYRRAIKLGRQRPAGSLRKTGWKVASK